jgi:autotransporter-associated beta strand protein
MHQQRVRLTTSLRSPLLILGLPLFFAMCGLVPKVCAETDLPHPTFTWNLSPTNNDWNTAANWTPPQVPDTSSEAAEFGSSTITDIVTTSTTINSIEFRPGASQYTLTGDFTFNAGGVINNSGVEQIFNGTFRFQKFGVTAGPLVTFNDTNGYFGKGTNAGSATYINSGHIGFYGGYKAVWYTTAGAGTFINSGTISFHKADAGSATFTNNGGATFGADGGLIEFNKSSDAADSTIINNGGAVFGGHGSRCTFHHFAGASNATLIANGGAGPGSGATILFAAESSGDSARVEVFGNGNLDISRDPTPPITIGSLEGNGLVFLGANELTVGANNLDTSFAGTISDEGGVHQGSGGAFGKTGTGTFSLTNANTYTGGTNLDGGSLFVNNTSGSGTGTGAVQANAGTLGGAGIIAGPVTIGTGAGSGAVLSPGASANVIGVFTLLDTLTFRSDGSCEIQLDSTTVTADRVIAQGVTIESGAEITVTDLGSSTLPVGTSFILIDNSATTAIAGAFTNLPDGGTLTVGSNTFAADYQGGDGNDLTLTVTP